MQQVGALKVRFNRALNPGLNHVILGIFSALLWPPRVTALEFTGSYFRYRCVLGGTAEVAFSVL